jgi:hypothetical protein
MGMAERLQFKNNVERKVKQEMNGKENGGNEGNDEKLKRT